MTQPDPIHFRRLPDGKFRLEAELWLPRTRALLFPFFADAYNLEQITPPWIKFHVVTPPPIDMHPGTLIHYRLRLRGIPLKWTTIITQWNPPHSFVDEQLKGPYRLWRHTHTFEERDTGTLLRDAVDYAMPGGTLANRLFVRPQLNRIFSYRQSRMRALFPPTP